MHIQLNRNTLPLLCLVVCLSCSVVLRASSADGSIPRHVDTVQVQRIVDDLKARLGIPHQVTVAIVDRNPLMASVAPVSGGGFALSFEAGFAEHLTEDELTAVIAHELGHVWIFTHFPFLQTEQLANEIAMRVVSRESLVPVYAQMFERAHVDADLSHYLSEPRADH